MIHIGTVMKVLGERKTFIKNHPDFLEFILRVFGGELEEGTVLEMRVIRRRGMTRAKMAGRKCLAKMTQKMTREMA